MKQTQKTALIGGSIGAAAAFALLLGMLALAPLQGNESSSGAPTTTVTTDHSQGGNRQQRPGNLPGERDQAPTSTPRQGFGGPGWSAAPRPTATPTR
jgi:hypothetical protein